MADILRTVDAIRNTVNNWRKNGDRIALVPTMGALHPGHMSLVEMAKKSADKVIVSIFVNPKQFGPKEDFGSYPRQEQADAELCDKYRVDAIYAPTVQEMYPQGFATSIHVKDVSEGLCGALRPGHFDGVATVVAKLLLQVVPDIAIFGEKDYQQLLVIKRLVHDLDIPVAIQGAPISREAEGLARSSRNAYLTPEERKIASAMRRTLEQSAERLYRGEDMGKITQRVTDVLLEAGFSKVDYVELRHAETLAPLQHWTQGEPGRLLAAAWLGKARLIDNCKV